MELQKGDKVLLNFILPPDSTISGLPGKIVNVHLRKENEYGLGVQYYPKEEHKELLDRYISIINEIKSMAGITDF